jgi:hypothetical protein
MNFFERPRRDGVNPGDQEILHEADRVLELAAINNLQILGSEKRVTEKGLVQYRPVGGEWITVDTISQDDISL